MGKATGQMQEDTQELLDFYNSHYNWEYNDMCRFIDNHSEQEFQEHYETYQGLCRDYGTELVDNFGLYFDLDASYYEKFEDMYEGEYQTATDFAEYYYAVQTFLEDDELCKIWNIIEIAMNRAGYDISNSELSMRLYLSLIHI